MHIESKAQFPSFCHFFFISREKIMSKRNPCLYIYPLQEHIISLHTSGLELRTITFFQLYSFSSMPLYVHNNASAARMSIGNLLMNKDLE